MKSDDTWLNLWLSANDLKKSGEYQSPGPLHVYTMTTDGSSPQFSGQLSAWSDLSKRLQSIKVQLGLVAIQYDTDSGFLQYPGVTIALESPFGGSMIARQVMSKLSALGIGGVLAGTEQGGRFGVLRIIMTPRWYVKTGDNLFGFDWTTVPKDKFFCDDAKRAWVKGMHKALYAVLSDIPPMFIDTVEFGVFDVVDWLHDLGPRETTYLYRAKPSQLPEALSKLISYDLDESNSQIPYPFDDDGVLRTIFDEFIEEVTPQWLDKELSSKNCIVLHACGRVTTQVDISIFLLRRKTDGRLRLTYVQLTPNSAGTRIDSQDVNPVKVKWSNDKNSPIDGANKIFRYFTQGFGSIYQSGMLHLPSPVITDSAYRTILTEWFRNSPSSAGIYDLLSDKDLRTITPFFRPNFDWGSVKQREITVEESEQLFEWLTSEDQRVMEGQWLLHNWKENWEKPGFTAEQVEVLLKRLGLKTWDGDKLS